MQFMIVFALIVSIFAVMFALQNPIVVPLNFIVWNFEASLTLYILISMVIGACIILILTIPGSIKGRKGQKSSRKEISELEDNLSKYRSNLIDAQNSNKDLRQKIIEIEDEKEKLSAELQESQKQVSELQAALNVADQNAEKANQSRKEAIDDRDNINLALREMELKLASAEEKTDTYKGMLEQMAPAMPFIQPGTGSEIDTLNEEAALDMPPTEQPAPEPAPAENAAEQPADGEDKSEGKKRFSWF